MSPAHPRAEAVLCVDGRIAAVGTEAASQVRDSTRGTLPDSIDLGGRVVVPGFIDAHAHILAYAASLVSVDCGPRAVRSLADLQDRLGEKAAALPAGAWVRATGYDELALQERRHPTRQELDAVAPANPVRLLHRGGHACVLNSLALRLAGIDASTPEPPGGYMERDLDTGLPTGLLIEMNELVIRVVPSLSEPELRSAVAAAGARFLRGGFTFVQDATHTNGVAEWRLLERLIDDGTLPLGVSMMAGVDNLGEMPDGAGHLRHGPVKIMPRELDHEFWPGAEDLAAMIERIERAGRTAAVHVVTRGGLDVVLDAFEKVAGRGRLRRGHRLEHAGLCSPEQAARIAAIALTVVTQPGFLYASGDLMLKRLRPVDLPDLYPLRRLLEAGVRVAGSTDAPVIEPDGVAGLRAAVTRRSQEGADMAQSQAISPEAALRMFTASAAASAGAGDERGVIAPGLAADFAVLNGDPTARNVDWDALAVEMTVAGGQVMFGA